VSVERTRVGRGDRLPFFDRLIHEATGVPGVAKATASAITPLEGWASSRCSGCPNAEVLRDS